MKAESLISLAVIGGIGFVAYELFKTGGALSNVANSASSTLQMLNPLAPGATFGPLTSTSGQKGNVISKSIIDYRFLDTCPPNQYPNFDKNGALIGCTSASLPKGYLGTYSGAGGCPEPHWWNLWGGLC